MIYHNCAGCGVVLASRRSKAGRVDECPRCGYKCVVPGSVWKRRLVGVLWATAVSVVLALVASLLFWPGLGVTLPDTVAGGVISPPTPMVEPAPSSPEAPAPKAP